MKKALIVWGGWDGHEPKQTAEIAASLLKARASRSRYRTLSIRSPTRTR